VLVVFDGVGVDFDELIGVPEQMDTEGTWPETKSLEPTTSAYR